MNKRKYCTDCPISKIATLLPDPWTILIVRDLLKKEMRFSDLQVSLKGISSRTLTNKIKDLESKGVVNKHKNFCYALTKKGKSLEKVIDVMSSCGKSFSK